MNIGPRSRGAELLGLKLFGGPVVRREGAEAAAGLRRHLCCRFTFLHRLGDPKVKDAEVHPIIRFGQEDVRRLDVPVGDPLAVGLGKGLDGGSEEGDGLFLRVGAVPFGEVGF